MRKKWLSFFIVLVLVLGICPAVQADVVDVKAESAVVMDPDSGRVLYEKNPDKRLPPASMTKLMTLILACEALEKGTVKPDEKVSTSENAWKLGGSQIYLEPGEEMTYWDMLVSIAVGSANDSCVAVAEHLAGSHEAFVQKMNDKAKQLGLKNTHFVNAYGLPTPDHYSSARDMATMGVYALKRPKLMELTRIKEYSLREGKFKLFNTNKLLWWYKGADGFKTGWTNEAKFCLVSTVKRNDLRLVASVLASPEARGNFRDSMTLYNYFFARYAYKSFVGSGTMVGLTTVGKGADDSVEIVSAAPIGTICEKGEESKITYTKQVESYVNAPLRKGDVIGYAMIFNNGKQVKRVDLVAARDVAKSTLWEEIRKMWRKIFVL
ncbi:MAG: D-alanyl-D-alanine carboxypeptidase family protein [Acidobacteriota bacterium]